MAEHNKLGEKGEELACRFLAEKDYIIVAVNWRSKHKEIDIVAMDKDILVFVEVKSRTENYWGNPEEFVTKKKQKLLISAAEAYIGENGYNGQSRFDIVSVLFEKDATLIEHIIEAFYP